MAKKNELYNSSMKRITSEYEHQRMNLIEQLLALEQKEWNEIQPFLNENSKPKYEIYISIQRLQSGRFQS